MVYPKWFILSIVLIAVPELESSITNYNQESNGALNLFFLIDTSSGHTSRVIKTFLKYVLSSASTSGVHIEFDVCAFDKYFYLYVDESFTLYREPVAGETYNNIRNASEIQIEILNAFNILTGGRIGVRNITIMFIGDYSHLHFPDIEQVATSSHDHGFEVVLIGFGLDETSALANISTSSNMYLESDTGKFNDFSAKLFFATLSYCGDGINRALTYATSTDAGLTQTVQYSTGSDENDNITYTTSADVGLTQWSANIVLSLTLDKSSLSSSIRKKTSATDRRMSSTVMGSIGAIVVIITALVPVFMDIPVVVKQAKRSLKQQRIYRRRQKRLRTE